MIYQHPLAYLVGVEGLALLRAWAGEGEHDEEFVRRRLEVLRQLLDDAELTGASGVQVGQDATGLAYARWATSYDDPGNGLFTLDEPVVDEVLGTLPVGTACDAACGTGRLTAGLVGRGFATVGVDASVEMLGRARVRVPSATFLAGDLAALPLADGAVDLVTTALALTHVPDLRPAYAELARVLRPGGSLVVSDVHADLVLLGSTVKAVTPDGGARLATTRRHSTGDHLGAALAAGFGVVRYEERPRPAPVPPVSAEPTREIGDWSAWPWTLLGWDPEAAAVALDNPAVSVWHLRRGG